MTPTRLLASDGHDASRMTGLFVAFAAIAFAAIAFAIAPMRAQAQQEDETVYASMAVQNRHHLADHELTLFGGIFPLDAFTKGATLSGAYTLHLGELWSWEIIHFFHAFGVDTDLRDDLAAFDLAPTPFETIENLATTNLVFRPVYWKGALLNDSVIYGELLFVFGGGYAWFTRSNRVGADVGLGFRVFLNEAFSVRLDLRYLAFFSDTVFDDFDIHSEIWAGLGLSLAL